jgi:hypothetical protein
MRCMMCGDDMVLTHAVPAETGGVQGFETQTHQCPACLGTERRFIFVGAKTDFIEGATAKGARAYAIKKVPQHANGADKSPVHHPPSSIKLIADPANEKSGARHDRQAAHTSVSKTTLVPSEPSLIESVIPLNAGNAPGQSWVRAVEKFRRYEADLHERVEKTKTTNPNLGTKASERITVPANDQMRRVTKSHDAPVRRRLGRRPPYAGPQGRAAVDHEALRRFDELWDDVPSPRNAQQPADASVEPALLTRLPPSGSLVAIESKTDPANNIRGKRVFKKMLEKVLQCLE